MSGLIATLAGELVTGDREDVLQVARLAARMETGGADGMRAMLDLARLIGEAVDPDQLAGRLDIVEPSGTAEEVALLVMGCFGALRRSYPSRPDAIAARSAIGARAEAAYRSVGEIGHEVLDWLVSLAGETVRQLSAIAADRAPLVRVETGFSLPSSLLAWNLYGDPGRGAELVERNRSATPMVMPIIFEAVAS